MFKSVSAQSVFKTFLKSFRKKIVHYQNHIKQYSYAYTVISLAMNFIKIEGFNNKTYRGFCIVIRKLNPGTMG